MAAMKILGYFNQDSGGECKQCSRRYASDDQREAIAHFENDHHWECLYIGTESHHTDRGIFHCTVYHYGTQ
jgi:hypothetical protein